jgi:hypothetical protein
MPSPTIKFRFQRCDACSALTLRAPCARRARSGKLAGMPKRVRWMVLGCLGFVACEGPSGRRDSGDDGGSTNDGHTVGGAPAAGGAAAGTAGATGGALNPTGGQGGTLGGQSGSGGATCAPEGISCSFREACDILGCGTAWSHYDEKLCERGSCAQSGTCELGERCVAAPVAGRFDGPCSNLADSCERTASGCECRYREQCFPSAVCLLVDVFPPENDCPIAALDCAELDQAERTLRGYLDGDVFLEPYEAPENVASSLEACRADVEARLRAECLR